MHFARNERTGRLSGSMAIPANEMAKAENGMVVSLTVRN